MVLTGKRDDDNPSSRSEQRDVGSSPDIFDAAIGDVIKIRNAGPGYSSAEFVVERKDRYEFESEQWYELTGMNGDKRAYLEIHTAGDITFDLGLDLTINDLGITEDDLIRFDEEESESNSVQYDDKKWKYDSSREVGYFEGGQGEGFYSWEFSSDSGEQLLSVEKWEGVPFEVGISKIVRASDISVYRNRL